ncbi:MAG: alkylhydroperoxidase [Amycolatopsis sp.]|nr:alkylhydroperoxidase [Amycolatopsis sp.]
MFGKLVHDIRGKLDHEYGPVLASLEHVTKRIQLSPGIPGAFKSLIAMSTEVERAAIEAGLDQKLLELVKTRASQLNGCAYCLDMHTTDAVKHGENPRRLFLLDAWRETDLFTEHERAALEVTEALTRLSQTQDLPDDVYERATNVFTEAQYKAVVWEVVVINSFNRLAVPGHAELPHRD